MSSPTTFSAIWRRCLRFLVNRFEVSFFSVTRVLSVTGYEAIFVYVHGLGRQYSSGHGPVGYSNNRRVGYPRWWR